MSGDFTVERVAAYEIRKEELVKELGSSNLVILDTHEPREYAGETPYGESRGGHVPGAKHNYAGSMWEWSASPAAEYPLVTR